MKKKIWGGIVLALIAVVSNVVIATYPPKYNDKTIEVQVELKAKEKINSTIYYVSDGKTLEDGFNEDDSQTLEYTGNGKWQRMKFSIPATAEYIRFDPSGSGQVSEFKNMQIVYKGQTIEGIEFSAETAKEVNESQSIKTGDTVRVLEGNEDPFIVWTSPVDEIISVIDADTKVQNIIIKLITCILIDAILLIIWEKRRVVVEIIKELISSRKLIISLAKNDFKTKFAGSYFGIVWAFVQPIVTVVVYWFVFDKALNAGTATTKAGITVPYVLWLIAGLVPWFFFAEAVNTGTNALIEYSYLVKKVVFKISILPIVKVVSALFVHLFFIAFTIILYSGYGMFPTWYTLQIIYYSFCLIMLCLGIVYMTSAIVIFFRDLTQVINIVLQVGMWATPIMWNMDAMIDKMNPVVAIILKGNPIYYIVSGYRDSLISHIWFWNRPEITLYFWLFTGCLFGLGFLIFRRTQVHFADVL